MLLEGDCVRERGSTIDISIERSQPCLSRGANVSACRASTASQRFQERLGNRKGGHSVSGWERWHLTFDYIATLVASIMQRSISAHTAGGNARRRGAPSEVEGDCVRERGSTIDISIERSQPCLSRGANVSACRASTASPRFFRNDLGTVKEDIRFLAGNGGTLLLITLPRWWPASCRGAYRHT